MNDSNDPNDQQAIGTQSYASPLGEPHLVIHIRTWGGIMVKTFNQYCYHNAKIFKYEKHIIILNDNEIWQILISIIS